MEVWDAGDFLGHDATYEITAWLRRPVASRELKGRSHLPNSSRRGKDLRPLSPAATPCPGGLGAPMAEHPGNSGFSAW